eukprot:TRINITY_DN18235_c0_g1_i1.p1 TRINITY_DN18235_c0_g1~~TRINITY_DN18235_c0_g1_i1.p1  ORF type:complete len:186 (-),score=60.86 TRINITY_DN18235_c0_g1_i1:120-644(-)
MWSSRKGAAETRVVSQPVISKEGDSWELIGKQPAAAPTRTAASPRKVYLTPAALAAGAGSTVAEGLLATACKGEADVVAHAVDTMDALLFDPTAMPPLVGASSATGEHLVPFSDSLKPNGSNRVVLIVCWPKAKDYKQPLPDNFVLRGFDTKPQPAEWLLCWRDVVDVLHRVMP